MTVSIKIKCVTCNPTEKGENGIKLTEYYLDSNWSKLERQDRPTGFGEHYIL